MKKSLIITMSFALFGFAGLATAQEKGEKGCDHRAKMLEKFDTNKDGELSEEEKKAFREKMGKKGENGKRKCHEGCEEMKKKLLEKYDADGDGKLSDEEKKTARAAWDEKRKGMEEKMSKMRKDFIEKHDTDGDGELSDDEKAAMKEKYKAAHEEFKAEMLEKYDADGDGELSEDERKEARAAEKQEILEMFDEDGSGELEGEERGKAGEWMMENRPFHLMHHMKHRHGGCHKGDKKPDGEKKEPAAE